MSCRDQAVGDCYGVRTSKRTPSGGRGTARGGSGSRDGASAAEKVRPRPRRFAGSPEALRGRCRILAARTVMSGRDWDLGSIGCVGGRVGGRLDLLRARERGRGVRGRGSLLCKGAGPVLEKGRLERCRAVQRGACRVCCPWRMELRSPGGPTPRGVERGPVPSAGRVSPVGWGSGRGVARPLLRASADVLGVSTCCARPQEHGSASQPPH